MAENSWPFENTDTTESQYTKLMRNFHDNAVLSGLALTTEGGMNLSLAIGSAIVQGWFYENTTAKTLVVPAADASNQRKDYVVLRIDTAANTITAEVKAGTPSAAGGTLPSLTQTLTLWEYPIHTVTVPAGAVNIVAGNLASRATRPSLRVNPYTNLDERDRLNLSGVVELLGINTTTKQIEFYNGSSWSIVTPELAWAAISGKPATFPPATHTHDDRYYTEAEIDSKVAAVSPVGHTHDDRYYTESEVDTKLGTKAATSHTHTIANITGLQTALDDKADNSDLSSYAPKDSPTFTGTVTAPTVAGNLTGEVNGIKFFGLGASTTGAQQGDIRFS